jgi:hypothetical protein
MSIGRVLSIGIMFTLNFIKLNPLVQKLFGGHTDTMIP